MTVFELLGMMFQAWGFRVDEDSVFWDCHTMGNRVCGPDHEN
jgi:hypothetical protein